MKVRPHPSPLPQEREKRAPVSAVALSRILCVAFLLPAVFAIVARADGTVPVFSSVVSWQFPEQVAVSPAVSYVFYEPSGSSPDTPLVSQVVSYRFHEWPGNLDSIAGSSLPVSYLYNFPGSAGLVSHVVVSQNLGTPLVDVFYDLSGTGTSYFLTVSVSTDGGATFSVPATHFTGDGVSSPTAPGTGKHIVWDAGADFPGQFSTKMRLKLVVGSAFALSPIFTIDTRAVLTGTLTGLVEGGGTPVANAQVRIDGTGFVASTGDDGRFTLSNVPAGTGYLLKVSAAGFASKPVPGVTVTGETKDWGTIEISPLSGPYRLVPLQPDVNPPVTGIEPGGVGYRYYRVLSADGQTPVGGVNVSLRLASGDPISQASDVSDSWAGRVAGLSDENGIVRLRVLASVIGGPGASASLEVVEAGTVKQQFQAVVGKRKYDKVWKHHIEAGFSTSKAILQLGGSGALETEVRDHYAEPSLLEEMIRRTRQLDAILGVAFDFSGPSLGNVKLGANGNGGFKVVDTYGFPPDDSFNLEKVYFALGDEMSVALGPAPRIYDELRKLYAPDLYASLLRSTAGEIHAGGEFNASAELATGAFGSESLRFGADLEGSLVGYFQAENQFVLGRLIKRTRELGLKSELSSSLALDAGGSGLPAKTLKELGFNSSGSRSASTAGKVWLDPVTSAPLSVGVEFENGLNAGMDASLLGWQGVGGSLGSGATLSATESLRYNLPSAAAYAHIQALSPVWNYLVGNFGAGWRLTGQAGSGLLPAILVAAEQDGVPLSYERSVYRGVTTDVGSQADWDKLLDGLGMKLDLSLERGAEAVLESGVIWQRERLPLKWRPDDIATLVPSESILSKEAQWVGYAAPLLKKAWNTVEHGVSSAGDTLIQVKNGARQALLTIGQGAMDAGSWVVSKVVGEPSDGGHLMASFPPRGRQPKDGGPANLAYGIGGIYRFESTNAFHGTATLTIAYSPAEVAGLNPAALRMYYLPDGTNRWQCVGGTVNEAASTVTATISRLGTYTLAPPLPTGDLELVPSTQMLAADGTSQMTVVVTNLMLNTGNLAAGPWMFTATAVGVSLLNADLDAATPGVQVMSTNGAVTLSVQAPVGGTGALVSLASVVGDAFGSVAINLLDDAAPATPVGVSATAGQSRIWISWRTNSEPDLAGYRVYYRTGASGPPWDGTSAVEGTPSPIMVTGTNCLLRGLELGTSYFIAVSAVDTTGNESPLSMPAQVATVLAPPTPPTAVVARFGTEGTNSLMWALSEDDGYNDRDVVRYEVWRAVMPGTNWFKAGEVPAGVGVFNEPNVSVAATQYLRYAVRSVDNTGLTSDLALAYRVLPNGTGVDNDGDAMSDDWEVAHGLNPDDPSDAEDDSDHDGLANLQEYLAGTDPTTVNRPYLAALGTTTNGGFALAIGDLLGRSATVQVSTNLLDWQSIANLNGGTNGTLYFEDAEATNATRRFYRAVWP